MFSNQQASPDLSTPQKIRDTLHSALARIGKFEQCALLDYPSYFNVGDHLIWLATVFYLTDVVKSKIGYCASVEDFSAQLLEKNVGQAPIILQGGGNFGDLWPDYQEFRERIIAQYRDRPIIIMPQSIYFANPDKLSKTAAIFNAHPNLTIFTRDNYSYELACKHFGNCQVIKSPDIVFHMVDLPLPGFTFNPKRPILYLCRNDKELNPAFAPEKLDLANIVVKDWLEDKWIYRGMLKNSSAWYWRIPGMVKLVREGWQKGLSNPGEWISRQNWERNHPYVTKIKALSFPVTFNRLYNCSVHQFSWSLMHSGIYRLKSSSLVITNRLHGHILAILLGIPNIFLPNSYHKNEAFYECWTSQLAFCRFVKKPEQIKTAIQELTNSNSN